MVAVIQWQWKHVTSILYFSLPQPATKLRNEEATRASSGSPPSSSLLMACNVTFVFQD